MYVATRVQFCKALRASAGFLQSRTSFARIATNCIWVSSGLVEGLKVVQILSS